MKKLGLIILALVMALGVLGAGYAFWSSNLNVNGTVETGDLIVAFYDPPTASGDDAQGIASTSASIDVNGDLLVTIHNGYPSYTGTVDFVLISNGTVNGKIKSYTIDGLNWDGGDYTVTDTLGNPLYTVTINAPAVGTVITSAGVNGSLSVHIAELSKEGADAPMDGLFSFTIGVQVTQFNAP
jgi:predicted ribosomally synthesized peptide with SipW-like signal peptide